MKAKIHIPRSDPQARVDPLTITILIRGSLTTKVKVAMIYLMMIMLRFMGLA